MSEAQEKCYDRFEEIVRIIRQRIGFGQTLKEIHKEVMPLMSGMIGQLEHMFYLCWQAARILESPLPKSINKLINTPKK